MSEYVDYNYHYFSTSDSNVRGCVYSKVTRYKTYYVVEGDVSFQIHGTKSSDVTGTFKTYEVQVNRTTTTKGTNKSFKIPNNVYWHTLCTYKYTFNNVSPYVEPSYSVGFKSTSDVNAFNVSLQTSGGYTLPVIATDVGAPTITITDCKNNKFKITAKTGANGTYNQATDCEVRYQIDGGDVITYKTGESAGKSHSNTITISNKASNRTEDSLTSGSVPVRVIATTLSEWGAVDSSHNIKDWKDTSINLYTAPYNTSKPTLTFYRKSDCDEATVTDKLTCRSFIKVKLKKGSSYNTNSPVKGTRIYIFTKKSGKNICAL